MAKDFIVAIELGSSKMTGIAGRKNLDGSIQVLACIKEDATACIRKGYVYNIDKTAQCITTIINKLESQLTGEQRETLAAYKREDAVVTDLYNLEFYRAGVQFGVRLLLEVLSGGTEPPEIHK